MERITELRKDPSVKGYVLLDAHDALSESIKERYEYLYVKIWEATKMLLNAGANPEKLTLDMPPYMNYAFSLDLIRKPGRHYVGTCNCRWRVYQDNELPLDQVVVGSDIGKVVVIALNFPELVCGDPLEKIGHRY
jgi:hypothetical protein